MQSQAGILSLSQFPAAVGDYRAIIIKKTWIRGIDEDDDHDDENLVNDKHTIKEDNFNFASLLLLL